VPEFSRLTQLVPTIGMFFTALPLRESFIRNNKKRTIASRRFVPPSFNDVRHILNSAQIIAVAPTLKLITFDGDMTLYDDGGDFAKDSLLVGLLVNLLRSGLSVAIVTAAGYPNDADQYELRLSGLIDGMRKSDLNETQLSRFYVFGGECNYLFQYDTLSKKLVGIPEEVYQTVNVSKWSNDSVRIGKLLDEAQNCIDECVKEMGLDTRVLVIRKQRALGVVPLSGFTLTREQSDEITLAVQLRLKNVQTKKHKKLKHLNKIGESVEQYVPIPFCAFSGGRDVWVDVGNKLIGVELLQQFLHAKESETLHLGDQLSYSSWEQEMTLQQEDVVRQLG
ncbi:IMP 5'-nucleotidase, partial [Nowakowskiella sp. JEL0078]